MKARKILTYFKRLLKSNKGRASPLQRGVCSLYDVHFSFGSKKIFQGATLSLKEGEIASIIGRSGAGKTTLFRLISGGLRPDKGTIYWERPPAFLHQESLLLPWRTVLDNLLLVTELGKNNFLRKFSLEKAFFLLERVGLKHCASLYPHQLSGGMQQRVSLARALLQESPLLLLDEPFASLDVLAREELYSLLQEIRDEFKKTILFITHDFRDALALSDRILVLNGGIIASEFKIDVLDPLEKEVLHQSLREAL